MGQQTSPSFSSLGGTLYADYKNNRFVISTNPNFPISFYGLLPDGTVGLVIAKTGVNVMTVFS